MKAKFKIFVTAKLLFYFCANKKKNALQILTKKQLSGNKTFWKTSLGQESV